MVSCRQDGLRGLAGRIETAASEGEITLAALTDFSWDRVHVFPPYTTREGIEARLGLSWDGAAGTGIHERDDVALLIFVQQGHVAGFANVKRGIVDFAPCAREGGYGRDEARFRVAMDGTLTAAPQASAR